jgi:hypothetical protein
VQPSRTTKYKFISIFGVEKLHISVTLNHLQALSRPICDLKQVVLCSVYKDGYKYINILLKISVYKLNH